jgi:hypothetical protein
MIDNIQIGQVLLSQNYLFSGLIIILEKLAFVGFLDRDQYARKVMLMLLDAVFPY